MFKVCCRCNEEKLQSAFRKDKTKKDGYQYYCKVCARESGSKLYKEKYATAHRLGMKARHAVVRNIVQEYKQTHPCICCAEDDPICLEFHHLNEDDKEFTISGNHNRALKKILEEIEKCVVLCSNCHRKVHGGVITLL